MKKTQIILLLLVIAGIVGMSFFIKDLTTHETFATAQKKGKFVVVKVHLDKTTPIEYDPVKDPNHTVFYAVDKDGKRSRVVYANAKITDMERSESLDLNGYMRDGYFECKTIQTKCPSKYKDDVKAAEKNLPTATTTK
jgi:cytochrome c-type biogenesis protein CcmE